RQGDPLVFLRGTSSGAAVPGAVASVDGQVVQVMVRPGDRVNIGDVVAVIQPKRGRAHRDLEGDSSPSSFFFLWTEVAGKTRAGRSSRAEGMGRAGGPRDGVRGLASRRARRPHGRRADSAPGPGQVRNDRVRVDRPSVN